MEVKVNRSVFLKIIAKLQSVTEKKSNMPILSTILLKAIDNSLIIAATDLEIGIKIEVTTDILQEGSITISGKKLLEILKESKKPEIHIKERENSRVLITNGTAHFHLACLSPDEFPLIIEPENVSMAEIDGDTLSEMIDKTIYSISKEEDGNKSGGIFIEKIMDNNGSAHLRFVATDGNRLSMVDKENPTIDLLELGRGVVIPRKGMLELYKIASEGGRIRFGFKKNNCIVKKNKLFLLIRLLETKFPDYSSILPKEDKLSIVIKKNELLDAMKKMLILSSDNYSAVKITLADNQIQLVSTNPELGEAQEILHTDYRGDNLEIVFNPRFFIDILQKMESEDIKLEFIDKQKPCILTGEADDGFFGLIMPMSYNDGR